MKKVGLIGGISWTSTLDYYRYINEGVNRRLGGLASCECIVYSLNFAEVQRIGWENSFQLIYEACLSLISSGVDGIALCANTAHLFADKIQNRIDIPIIHILTATANAIRRKRLSKIGLLGTRFTMQMDFYRKKLEQYGIETLVPESHDEVERIHSIVKDELGKGIVRDESRNILSQSCERLCQKGAEGIVLACTEIPLAISQKDLDVPAFDTTKIHANAIVDFVLE